MLSTLALAPGIVVNLILKNHWGRPRPGQIDAIFGGDASLSSTSGRSPTTARRNCSFVSGEGSSAIWLMVVALLCRSAGRCRLPSSSGLMLAIALSLNRIAFGGHFLSDVLLCLGADALIIAFVYRLLYVNPPAALTDADLDAALGRAGAAAAPLPADP